MARFSQGGVVYEEMPDGQVRVVGYEDAPRQAAPTAIQLPRSPSAIAKDGYEANADRRGDIGTGIAVRNEQRQAGKDAFEFSRNLRKDFDDSAPVKAYQTIIRQYGNGVSAAPTAAGDQALINAYSQMLNPTSTVMLGEYQAAEQNDTTLNKVRERLKREFGWDGAGRISDVARGQLLDEMQAIAVNSNRSYNQERDRYRAIAARNGVRSEDVIGPHIGEPFFDSIEQARLGLRKGRTQAGDPDFEQSGGGGDLNVRVTDDRPGTPTAPPSGGGDYRDSYAGQGMSGINEGIALGAGAPVDLMTLGMNLPIKGINALTNSNLPTIDKPFLGSDYIKDKMDGWATYGESKDPWKQSLRRVGQSVGAAAVPLGAAPGGMSKALQALGVAAGGGAGAAAAQQAFPGNPVAEFTGEVLGSGLTAGGLLGSSRRAAVRKVIEGVPSRDQLRDQASNLYNTAESRGVVAGPNVTTNLAGRVRDIARNEELITPTGRVSADYPRASEAMRLLEDYSGANMNPKQIQVVRDTLADAKRATQGKEQRIAGKMLGAFDDETIPLAPELADARRVSSRYLQADDVRRAKDLAEARAAQFSGSGMENAIRTEFRKLDRGIINDSQRFNPATEEAITMASRGTKMSNALRALGKLAPTGVVSAGVSGGVPFMIGNAVGGPAVGAAASAATMGIGGLARKAATRATENQASLAEILARNGGPLNLPPLIDDETRRALERAAAGQGSQYIPR